MDPVFAEALARAEGLAATPSNLDRVARATSDAAARWAFGQHALRQRGRAKFARADAMLFVREALEQATHEAVAAYRAGRFPAGAPVADLGCGIGADLIALARRGPATGVELDAERAAFARHNLAVHGLGAEVVEGDALAWMDAHPEVAHAFADPARRAEGRRTRNLAEFSPDPAALAVRFAKLRLGAIKLGPMAEDRDLEALGPRLEFVSYGGECREALVWTGQDAQPGRFAVRVEGGATLAAGGVAPVATEVGPWVHDADPASVRAHALGTLAHEHGLRALGDAPGYLTGPPVAGSPWLRSYRVRHEGKWDLKRVRALLRTDGAATPVLKQRGAGQELEALRRGLVGPEDGAGRPTAVLLYAVGRSVRFVIADTP